jgi:hypothetical protein
LLIGETMRYMLVLLLALAVGQAAGMQARIDVGC